MVLRHRPRADFGLDQPVSMRFSISKLRRRASYHDDDSVIDRLNCLGSVTRSSKYQGGFWPVGSVEGIWRVLY